MTSFVTKYLIQANIILTFCILVVLAVRFLIRRYARIFSYFAWGIVCFGLVYFFVSPLQFPLHAVYSFLSGKSGQNETATAGDAVVTQTFPDGTAAVNDLSAPPAVSDGRAMAGTGLPDKIAAISPDFLQIPHPEEWMRVCRLYPDRLFPSLACRNLDFSDPLPVFIYPCKTHDTICDKIAGKHL